MRIPTGRVDEKGAEDDKSTKKPKDGSGSSKAKIDGPVGFKHDKADLSVQQGTKSRLSKKGQTAHRKAMPS